MRKAIIAAIVASALFAVGALAANFTVTSEDVASGFDEIESCADRVEVEYVTTPPTGGATDADYTITTAEVRFLDEATPATDPVSFVPATACVGADIDVAILSGTWYDSAGCTAEQPIDSAPVTASCEFATPPPVQTASEVRVLADGALIDAV